MRQKSWIVHDGSSDTVTGMIHDGMIDTVTDVIHGGRTDTVTDSPEADAAAMQGACAQLRSYFGRVLVWRVCLH